MRKRGRIYRTLAAAKHAFFDEETYNPFPPQQHKEKPPAPANPPEPKPAAPEPIKTVRPDPLTVEDLKSEYCTGCGACYNLCPTEAIKMEYNAEGFSEPVIDPEKCIKCGLCLKKCPSYHPTYKNDPNPPCYASYGKDDIRMKSSSGAIFSLISSYILQNGGYVCGAAFDDKFVLRHTLVNSEKDMQKLRESKYVQTDTNTVFTQIGELLKKDTMVLFSGCGCQTAGLYAYLDAKKISTDKLYTIDLMCHGSPSPKLFEQYINEVHGGPDNIESLSFRSKEYFGWSTEMNVKYKDGSVYRKTRSIDPYYKAFLPCISVRKACGRCTFAKLPRQGDITLADFWGVANYDNKLTDGKGTSIVVINNEKGQFMIDAISKELKLHDKVDIDYILTHGQPFDHSFKTHPAHDLYFKNIRLGATLDKAFEYSTKRKFDVGIYGVWPGCNYGSIATYYALHEVITGFGLSVIMIDKPIIRDNDPEQAKTHSRRFAEEHYEISRKYKLNELAILNGNVDTFVMGSDQVWNRGISKNFGMSYYFDFVQSQKKKIAYAASFGHATDFAGVAERCTISEYMSRFDHISVREADGVKICKDVYGVNATQVLDPVFVADREVFEKLTEKSKANDRPDKDEKYICTYILDPTPEKKKALKWVSEQLGLKLINVLDGFPWTVKGNTEKMSDMGEIPKDVQVEDWLYYIKNSEFLITDSCHGISFGIVFKRPFIGIANKRRGLSRFQSLLGLFELTDRYVTDPSDIVGNTELLKPVDYDKVYKILEAERTRSKDWLKNALFSPKEVKTNCAYSSYDIRLKGNTDNEKV